MPLIDHQLEQVLGALSVFSPKANVFTESHQYILSILVNQAAVAIQKACFFEEREQAQTREKQAIRDLFQRYVNPTVVERLVKGRDHLALGGIRQQVSVMFADLRGFTAFSEHQPPEALVEILNQYFALAVEAILAQEGTLDKFMGDAIMAFFNAPLPQANHTLRAAQAALAMQRTIIEHNLIKAVHRPLNFGIGLHTGPAVVGNIGTAQQMNYTAIGDTVNLAKRLQENAQEGQILLSQAAYEALKDVAVVRDLGPLTVKGRTAAEHVYVLIDLKG
jgi:adenylate cyclase